MKMTDEHRETNQEEVAAAELQERFEVRERPVPSSAAAVLEAAGPEAALFIP